MQRRLKVGMIGMVGCCVSMALTGLGVSLAEAGTAPIVASPGALLLKAVQGQTATGTLLLTKSGSDQHTYYLSTNQGWIWMNPPYGSTQTISTETDSVEIVWLLPYGGFIQTHDWLALRL